MLLLVLIVSQLRGFQYPHHRRSLDLDWESACLFISLLGLAIRIHVVGHSPAGTSGRNTHAQVADRLNTTGMYSTVRHPLYLGNFLISLGISMFPRLWWLVLVCLLVFWLYYERIMFAEESFLKKKFGNEFENWAARTPAFVPHLGLWKRPASSFCLRTVLRREYSGLLAIAAVFLLLDFVSDLAADRAVEADPFWLAFSGAALAIYVTLRFLKRHTHVLQAPGR